MFGISGSVALLLCGYLGTKKCIFACCTGRGGEHICIYIYIHRYSHTHIMYICIFMEKQRICKYMYGR